LIIVYIYDITTRTRSLFGKAYSTKVQIGFLRSSEEEIYIILSVSQRTGENILKTAMFSSLLLLQGVDF